MIEEEVSAIVNALTEVREDNTVPKNVRERVSKAIEFLIGTEDLTTKVHKAMQELEELSDDTTMQSFTRSQIWNIVSCLESIQ